MDHGLGLWMGQQSSYAAGAAAGFSLTAPVLAFASATDPDSDNTQDFNATFFEDIEGYYIRLVGTYGSTVVGSFDIDQFNLIDSSESGALLATFLTGAIPNGAVAFKCRIQSGAGDGTGIAESNWSNTVTKEINQALPTLSSPVDSEVTATTGSGSVSTDIIGGTLYFVVSTSASAPSAAQIKAGQMHTGAAAADSGSQGVTATGVNSITGGFAGLTESTAYTAHYVHETVNGFSNVSSANGFTTPSTFVPTDLANLALWLDPSDLSSMFQLITSATAVAADSDPVGTINDKSGNSFHLTAAANDTTRPLYKTSGGLRWLEFDGSNDILRRAATLGLYANGTASVFAAVHLIAAGSSAGDEVVCEGGTSTSAFVGWIQSDTTSAANIGLQQRNDAAGGNSIATKTSGFDGADHVFGVTDSGSSLVPYWDSSTGLTPIGITRTGTYTIDRFSIGGRQRATAANFAQFRLYGLIIVKAVVSQSDINKIIPYLGAKAGLTLT